MKIRKLTLENVKSYQKEVIEFHDGINVISGRNGAGKTTIIEAIGLALFGYMNRDYNYQDFISHGASSGSIIVEFEVEGCLYQIERSFGIRGTKSWVLSDLQTDEVVETHTVEDVNFMLMKILGMQEELNLAELFERIIGVSQGTFTEPFLRSAAGRKEYFERIFMLDSYKVAYQKSSDPASILRSQCDNLEKELIRLRTRVEEYPVLRGQYKEEELKLSEHKQILKVKDEQLKEVKQELQIIKAVKEQIQEMETQRQALEFQQKQLTERLIGVKEELEVSKKANELVLNLKPTHALYQQVKEQITGLEKSLEEQVALEAEKIELEKEVAVIRERLATRRDNYIESRQKLTREVGERREELEEYSIPMEGIDRELRTVGDEVEKNEKALAEHGLLSQSYQSLAKYYDQLEERAQEYTTLQNEIIEQEKHLQEIPRLEAEVAKIRAGETALEKVNHIIAAIETRIQNEEENMERVGDGLCPLLKTECKTIEGENLREYFLKRVMELGEERQQKLKEKEDLTEVLQTLRLAERELAGLESLRVGLKDRMTKLKLIESRGNELVRQIHDRLQDVYKSFGNLKKSGYLSGSGDISFKEMLPLDLEQECKRLYTEMDIIQNYLHLSFQEIKAKEKLLTAKKEELTSRKATFTEKLAQVKVRITEIEQSLQEVIEAEAELAREAKRVEEDLQKIKQLVERLQTFGDLRGQLKKAKEELIKLEDGNKTYLQNQQKASELPSLIEQELRFTSALEEAATTYETLQEKLREEGERFNPEVLAVLEERSEELNRELTQAQTLLQEGERRQKELIERIKEMEQTKAQIKIREKEESKVKKALDLMNFIRNVYNTSAEEIAQVFLQFISHEATNIYRQLSGENVQLIWEKDYQVKIKDKHRIRLFKQLSGGEQMSAAFAIRLALLRKFSTVRLGFFDEPTTHLDEFRRVNIAQAIANMREKGDDYFEQIFVISHDDTFTTLTENLIRIDKGDEGSYLVL